MNQLIENLKQKRLEFEQAKEQIEQLRLELEQTEAWHNLIQAKEYFNVLSDELEEVDNQVREKALLEYATTGNKKPFNGVSVVINKRLEYQETEAIRWCSQNAQNLLRLDKRHFEKHARSVIDTVPLEFVKVQEEPGVRIAREL